MSLTELTAGPIDYGLALLAGLLASGHCIGMCGALASAAFIRLGGQARRPLPYLLYQLARVGVYSLIGVVAATAGRVVVSVGGVGAVQGVLQVAVGLVVVVIGLNIAGLIPWQTPAEGLTAPLLGRWMAATTKKGPMVGAFLGGVVNGLLPCPLTFALAIKAATAPGPLEGGLLMAAFGLGTVPSMLFVTLAFGLLGARSRALLLRGAALTVVVLGLATAYQGLTYFNIMWGLAF
jgi:sulfite exporter TauE/SafE